MVAFSNLTPTPKGLMLAGVVLAKRSANGGLYIEEEKLRALLTVACGKRVSSEILRYIRRAGELFADVKDNDLEYADYPLPRPEQTFSGNRFPAIAKLTMLLAFSLARTSTH